MQSFAVVGISYKAKTEGQFQTAHTLAVCAVRTGDPLIDGCEVQAWTGGGLPRLPSAQGGAEGK